MFKLDTTSYCHAVFHYLAFLIQAQWSVGCSLVALYCFFLLNGVNAGPMSHLLGAAVVATSPRKAKINLDQKKHVM